MQVARNYVGQNFQKHDNKIIKSQLSTVLVCLSMQIKVNLQFQLSRFYSAQNLQLLSFLLVKKHEILV